MTRQCQREGCVKPLPQEASSRRQFCSRNCSMAVWRARQPKTGRGRCPDLTGQRFGRLLVIERAPNQQYRAQFLCQCDCGTRAPMDASAIRTGRKTSCGCHQREQMNGASNPSYRHGESTSRLWRSWRSMRQRCLDPAHRSYADYGGRGITICPEWDDFNAFRADMGERPEGMSLDRIDSNGNYEPGNCRWATPTEQNNNRRRARSHRSAKLTEHTVRELRRLHAAGTGSAELMIRYDLTRSAVLNAAKRKTWRWVT